MQNINNIQLIATGAALNALPAVGQEWVLEKFGSSVWTAAGAPNDTPRLDVGIHDGVQANGPAWIKRSGSTRGWTHAGKLYLTNTNYGVLRNPGAGGNQNLSYAGNIAREFGNGPVQVITDVQTVLAAGNVLVRPPVGEEWCITEIGSSEWVGAAPAGLPEVNVDLTDGVSFARILRSTDAAGWFTGMRLYLNNNVYLRIVNADGANPATIGWSGFKLQTNPSGLPNVMSQVATVGIGGTLDAQPTGADEEWEVSAIGASVWIGAPPASLPDVDVLLNDGVLTSLLAQNSDNAWWLSSPSMPLRRLYYLTITDTGGGGGDLGFSAIRTRVIG